MNDLSPHPSPRPPSRAAIAAWVLLVVAAGVSTGCSDRGTPDLRGWNVLLLTLDTLRQDRVGIYGHETARTPTLDALGAGGVVFDHAVAATPTTLASHTSILTGLHPPRHGVRGNAFYSLPDSQTTLAEILEGAGYRTTAVVGSTVLGRRYGLAQGFEKYDDASDTMARTAEFDAMRPAHEVTRAAILKTRDWIPGGQPWFLWAHYYAPHLPHTPRPAFTPPEADPMDPGVAYDAEVAFMDHQVGVLLDAMKNRGLLDRTLIVVVGDHGEGFAGPHEERTHGMFVYHDTQRVPLIIRADGGIRGGRRTDRVVGHVDLVPTILDLIEIETELDFQGASFRDVLETGKREDPAPTSVVYSETLLPWEAYGWSPLFAIRDDRFKLIEGPFPELYDLAADPDESRNLAAEQPELVSRMRARIRSVRDASDASSARAGAIMPDDDDLHRLEALGYVIGGRDAAEIPELSTLSHPRERYPLIERLDDATLLEEQGETSAAIRELEAIRKEDPRNFDVLRRLAVLRLGADQQLAAVAIARELVSIRPDLPHAYTILADALIGVARIERAKGDDDEAGRYFDEAIAVLGSVPNEHLIGAGPAIRLATAYREVGREDEALDAYERALELDPRSYTAARGAGEIRIRRGELDLAIRNFELAANTARDDEERKPILVRLLRTYEETGRPNDARTIAAAILERYSGDPAAALARRTLDRIGQD